MNVGQSGGIRWVFCPEWTRLPISCCWWGLSFGRRPPIRPCDRTVSRPLRVRFAQHYPLEFGKGNHNLHHHAASWWGGVNGFRQAAKTSSSLVDFFHQGQCLSVNETTGRASRRQEHPPFEDGSVNGATPVDPSGPRKPFFEIFVHTPHSPAWPFMAPNPDSGLKPACNR